MNGTRGIGRRWRHADADATAVIADPTDDLERQMNSLAADATSARLFELERIHEDATARHVRLARDYDALLEALHARSPQEWHHGDPATSALSYLRHLEDEADRWHIDRRPPWVQRSATGDERVFRGLAAELGAEEQFGLPVPPAESTRKGTGSEGREEETAALPPGAADTSSRPGDADPVPEAARPPAGEDSGTAAPFPSPEASGAAHEDGEPVQDEPDAEADCGETGDVA